VSVACSWAARCGTGPRGWAVWQRRAGWCVAHGGAGLGGTGPQATHARTVEVGQLSPSPSLFLCSSSSLFPLSPLYRSRDGRSFSGDGRSRSGHGGSKYGGGEPRAGCCSVDATTEGSLRLFLFFKSINGSGDHKMSPSINGLTEAGDAIATVGLD
jgi:hypothetical protein